MTTETSLLSTRSRSGLTPLWQRALRVVVGLFFCSTGLFKLFGSVTPDLPAGPSSFAAFLDAAGIPFPLLNAWLVMFLEVGAGLALLASVFVPLLSRLVPLVAAALASDMVVAILTVGLRTQRGDPVLVNGVVVAGEPWRLGLEALMLALLVVIGVGAWRARPRRGAAS